MSIAKLPVAPDEIVVKIKEGGEATAEALELARLKWRSRLPRWI